MARLLALTLGEPAGIGPDITFAAWRRRIELNLAPFYLLADPDFVVRYAQRIAPPGPLPGAPPRPPPPGPVRGGRRAAAAPAVASALPVVAIGVPVSAQPAHPDRSSAPAALAA